MRDLTTVLVTDKESGQSVEVGLEALGNLTNSVIMLSVGPEEIASIEAQSGNLVITLKSGETIVMEGFFAPDEAQRNELILKDSSGLLWWGQYDSPWSEFSFTEINPEEVEEGGDGIGWWLLAALAAVGIAAAAGSSSSSSSSSPTDPATPETPDAPTVDSVTNNFNEQGEPTGTTVTGKAEPGHTVVIRDKDGNVIGEGEADEDGNYTVELDDPLPEEEHDVVAIDDDGKESDPTPVTGDLTPPDAPSAEFNDTGDAVSGEAEPGSTVIVRDADGNELGRTEADEDGNYTVELDEPLTNGEEVEVTATDEAGNVSDPTTAAAPDTTAPDAPTVTIGDGDEYISAAEIDEDGNVTVTIALPGDAKAGDTLTVNGDEIELTEAHLTAGEVVTQVAAPAEGETLEVTATVTDAAGNESEPGTASATVDTTAPDLNANSIAFVDPNSDGWINADEVGGVELVGQLDADDDVTITSIVITDVDGGSVTIDADDITITDGVISVAGQDLSNLADGELTVTMTVTDAAGNSEEVTDTIALDATAPAAPTLELANDTGDVDGVTSDGTVSVGGLEEGATWEYSTDGGDTWIAGTGDSFVLLDGEYVEGEVLARQTDEAGNLSDDGILEMDVTVEGSTPTITIDTIAGDDVLNLEESQEELAIIGTTTGVENGQTVTITLNGETYSGEVEDNVWSVTVPANALQSLNDGEAYTVTADVSNAAGTPAEQGTRDFSTDFTSPGGDDGTDAPVLAIADAEDGFINAEELDGGIEAVVELTEGTQEGDTVMVTLTDAEGVEHSFEHTVTAGDLTEGEVSLTLDGDFPEGDASAVAVITDEAGNSSADSNEVTFEIDTASPGGDDGTDAPVLTITDAEDGFINAEELADGIQAVVTLTDGTQEGDTVTVTLTDAEGIEHSFEHTVTAGDLTEGEVSLTLDGDFAEGDASAVAVITDEAGNSSAPSDAVEFEIDTTTPDTPVITGAVDDVEPSGALADGDSSNDSTPTLEGTAEAGSTVTLFQDGAEIGSTTADATGNWSFEVPALSDDTFAFTATATDAAGNVSEESDSFTLTIDTTAPDAPTAEFNEAGDEVSGEAEPGSTVTVYDEDGNELGTTTADADDGSYTVEIDPALTNGEEVTVTATDEAGNESGPTSATAPDTTAPDAPTAEFNEAGDEVTGEAEPGSTVIVRDADGNELGRTEADEDGNYAVELDEPLTNGEEVTVTATDEAGNESDPTPATAPDTTAPDAPSAEFNDTGDAVSGEAEPGSTVIVRDADGNELGRTEADEDGNYTVELNEPLTNGEEVTVTATDEAGNESGPTSATAPDTTAPDAPTAEFNDTGDAVTGEAEPGSTVIVRDADGNELGRTEADEDGNYTVELDEPLTNGEEVEVTATDEAGNVSDPTTAAAPDTTAPDAPSAEFNDTGDAVSGEAEPGSTVIVRDADGNELGRTEADEDGNYTVELDEPLTNGEEVEVTATDEAGNVSDPTTAAAPDTTAPDAPSAEFNDTGDAVTGEAEPGSTVTVYDEDGNELGTTTADADDGSYTVEIDPALTNGEEVTVTATDEAGNVSSPTTAAAPDTTAPDAPTAEFNEAGDEVSGEAEPGSTVIVRDADGNELGRTEADEDGNYTVELDEPLTNGEEVTVTATDEAGNESGPTSATAPDTTAPNQPGVTIGNGDAFLTADDLDVEGNVEVTIDLTDTNAMAGDTLTVNDVETILTQEHIDAGEVVTAVEAPEGGGTLEVTATLTDASGNESEPGTASATALMDGEATANLGNQTSLGYAPESVSEVQVIDLIDSFPEDAGTTVIIGGNEDFNAFSGDLEIEVSQVGLLAVAGAFRVDVYDADGNLVHTATTADSPLVGDVAGLSILGLTDDGALTTTVTGLEPGEYQVIVRSDESTLAQLVGDLTLSELGDGGVVLGEENQEVVLDAVREALNGTILDLLGLGLGDIVVGILEPVLAATTELGAGELVDVLVGGLNDLGLTYLVDDVLDAVAEALLTETLTLLERTEVTTTLTEHGLEGDGIATGTVDTGADVVDGSVVTEVTNSNGDTVSLVDGTATIQGAYGELVINEDGSYTYTANGDVASLDQQETFTYTVSDGESQAEAELTITIEGELPFSASDDTATIEVEWANVTDNDFHQDDGSASSVLLVLNSPYEGEEFEIASNMELSGVVIASSTVNLVGNGSLNIQRLDDNDNWVTVHSEDFGNLVGLANEVARIDIAELDLEPGTYRVHSQITGLTADVNIDGSFSATYLDQFEAAFVPVSGNLLDNDEAVGASLQILDPDTNEYVAVNEPITIEGAYGSLTVDANGNYTYIPSSELEHFTESQSEEFEYQLFHPNGQTAEGSLTVTLEPSGAGVEEDMAGTDQGSSADLQAFMVADDGIDLEIDAITEEGVIDLRGNGADRLELASDAVLELSDADNILVIQGDEEDTLNIAAENWEEGGSVLQDGLAYTQYTFDDTTLLVQEGVNVEVS